MKTKAFPTVNYWSGKTNRLSHYKAETTVYIWAHAIHRLKVVCLVLTKIKNVIIVQHWKNTLEKCFKMCF